MNSLDILPMYLEQQEDISELPETLRRLRLLREKIQLPRTKRHKKVKRS